MTAQYLIPLATLHRRLQLKTDKYPQFPIQAQGAAAALPLTYCQESNNYATVHGGVENVSKDVVNGTLDSRQERFEAFGRYQRNPPFALITMDPILAPDLGRNDTGDANQYEEYGCKGERPSRLRKIQKRVRDGFLDRGIAPVDVAVHGGG